MRELKFRVWDIGARIMRDDGTHPQGNPHMKYEVGVLSPRAKVGWTTGIDGLNIKVSCEQFVLMQYTGIKDKNGKEIYEGDVIQAIDSEEEPIRHKIIFEDASFQHVHLKYDMRGRIRQEWITEIGFEVIGNIHQNPELLS